MLKLLSVFLLLLLQQDPSSALDVRTTANDFVYDTVNSFLHDSNNDNDNNEHDTSQNKNDIKNGEIITTPVSYFVLLNNGCGGSLVHGDIVLTAKHCVEATDPPTSVRIGATTRTNGEYANVVGTSVYTGCTANAQGGDVAVLKLANFSSHAVVELNTNGNTPNQCGQSVYAMGFGLVSDATNSDNLRGVTIPTAALCGLSEPSFCATEMVCADSRTAGTCAGDSGSPIVLLGTNIQIGVNSYSNGSCNSQTVDIYMKVSHYQAWIQEQICALSSQPPSGKCPSGLQWAQQYLANRASNWVKTAASASVGTVVKGLLVPSLRNNDRETEEDPWNSDGTRIVRRKDQQQRASDILHKQEGV